MGFLQTPDQLLIEEKELGCSLEVPADIIRDKFEKGCRLDIHIRSDQTSACLTKANGQLPRGYSPLVVVNEDECGPLEQRPKLSSQGDGASAATDHVWHPGVRVRYLSPVEQLRLMGYPETHSFPSTVSLRERCALIGNSLNVRVVAWLLR